MQAAFVAVILGGNFGNAANSGSRASNWNNAASNSNGNIGARGCCDDRFWLCAGLAAWLGHAGWADSHNLLRYLGLENVNGGDHQYTR